VFAAALLCSVFAVETAWYAIVALVLSSPLPRAAYLGCKTWVDRAAGVVLLGLGMRLVASARDA
jgi:threonine/homoserine/homoserine lactone efflux protein